MKPKILTNAQAIELKFFCRNVVGVRQDFYKVTTPVTEFDARLKRLEKTCSLIEKYLGEELNAIPSFFDLQEQSPDDASGSK